MGISSNVWCFMCVSWTSSSGEWKIVLNGIKVLTGTNLQKKAKINAGQILIGKMFHGLNNSCSQQNCFLGEMTNFHIWDTSLSDSEIYNVHRNCSEAKGSMLSWNTLKSWITGGVILESVALCTPTGEIKTLVVFLALFNFAAGTIKRKQKKIHY